MPCSATLSFGEAAVILATVRWDLKGRESVDGRLALRKNSRIMSEKYNKYLIDQLLALALV